MNNLTYTHAIHRIIGGHAELLLCFYNTIMRNKALSLLIVSLAFNCALVVCLAQQRTQNDRNSEEIMRLELLNDSLSGASTNISFRYN